MTAEDAMRRSCLRSNAAHTFVPGDIDHLPQAPDECHEIQRGVTGHEGPTFR